MEPVVSNENTISLISEELLSAETDDTLAFLAGEGAFSSSVFSSAAGAS